MLWFVRPELVHQLAEACVTRGSRVFTRDSKSAIVLVFVSSSTRAPCEARIVGIVDEGSMEGMRNTTLSISARAARNGQTLLRGTLSQCVATPPVHAGRRHPLPSRIHHLWKDMPLSLIASRTSRVQKPAELRRSVSSPFASNVRTKTGAIRPSLKQTATTGGSGQDYADCPTISLNSTVNVRSVEEALKYARESMFAEIPERAGMNSVRIADVLNFRKALPPIVSFPHVHILVSASSRVEREITTLTSGGVLRKLKVTGRGNNVSGISEVVLLTSDLLSMASSCGLSQIQVSRFEAALKSNPQALAFTASTFGPELTSLLVKTGFLTSSSLLRDTDMRKSSFNALLSSYTGTAESTGSVDMPDSGEAFAQATRVGTSRQTASLTGHTLSLSIPNLGAYLRLLDKARDHLIDLLEKSPHSAVPLYLLRERWDGNAETDSRASAGKRIRGEFSGLLPGKTKKWKDLYGLKFEWALEECLGAGLIELFATSSVGHGVRIV